MQITAKNMYMVSCLYFYRAMDRVTITASFEVCMKDLQWLANRSSRASAQEESRKRTRNDPMEEELGPSTPKRQQRSHQGRRASRRRSPSRSRSPHPFHQGKGRSVIPLTGRGNPSVPRQPAQTTTKKEVEVQKGGR